MLVALGGTRLPGEKLKLWSVGYDLVSQRQFGQTVRRYGAGVLALLCDFRPEFAGVLVGSLRNGLFFEAKAIACQSATGGHQFPQRVILFVLLKYERSANFELFKNVTEATWSPDQLPDTF